MKNTVLRHTFLKLDQSKKPRFSIKILEAQIKQKKTDLVKKTAVATLLVIDGSVKHDPVSGS